MPSKNASFIIFISEIIKSHCINKYEKIPENIIIHNGVEKPLKSQNKYYLEKIGVRPKKYIFSLGRFLEEKGFQYLIDAFVSIKQDEYKLVISGDADYPTSYSRKLKKLAQASENVILTGYVKGENLSQLFSNTCLFIFPSLQEGNPIALLEALSYSIPVIASNIEPNLNIGLNAECYFKAGDKEELKHSIIRMLKSERTFSYSELLSSYNWEDIAEQTSKVFHKIKESN